MAGGVVSTKERCWTQVARLPQASVAFQVRSIPGTPAQAIAVIASGKVIVTGPPQLSVAVAEPVCAGSVGSRQLSCWSAGQVMAAGVGRLPGAVNAGEARAIGRGGRVDETDRDDPGAVVRGSGRASVGWIDQVTAVELPIGGARDGRGRGVDEGQVLDTGGQIAAGVGRLPGAVNAGEARATGHGRRVGESDRDDPCAVVG